MDVFRPYDCCSLYGGRDMLQQIKISMTSKSSTGKKQNEEKRKGERKRERVERNKCSKTEMW